MMEKTNRFRILKRVSFGTLFCVVAVLIFGFLTTGINVLSLLGMRLVIISITFFLIFLSFYITLGELQRKNKIQKPFPYFLWVVVIPVLVSIVILPILNYMLDNAKFEFQDWQMIVESHILTIGSFSFFLGLFYYLKFNYKVENISLGTIDWSTKEMMLRVFKYAILLSLIFTIILTLLSNSYLPFNIFKSTLFFTFHIGIALICWYAVRYFNIFFEKKVSFSLSLLLTIFITVVIMQFILPWHRVIYILLFEGLDSLTKYTFTVSRTIGKNFDNTVYVIFCTLFYQILFFKRTRTVEQKAFKAEIGKQTEKYESLRRQLSPHFLFNNINVLTALIEENPQKAVHFSESLGNIYRHFLRQENEDIVSLQSALSFSKDYLELLKYRYEEGFQYVIPETIDTNHYIIPLALQQVIENTIKHNEVSKENPLLITIGIEDNYLIVQNTKQLKEAIETTKKTGIENIHKRYAFLTEKNVIVEDSTTSFTIKLPLLNMENS